MVPYKSTYLISAKSRCKYNLCSIWSKLNHTVRSYCKKCDPIPLKSIVAVESNCLSITDCNFLFHHCTLARNALPTTRNILRVKIVTSHLGLFFSIKWPMVLGPTFVNEYGRGGIFVNCMMSNILSCLRKNGRVTMVCAVCRSIILRDHQTKVYTYSRKISSVILFLRQCWK